MFSFYSNLACPAGLLHLHSFNYVLGASTAGGIEF